MQDSLNSKVKEISRVVWETMLGVGLFICSIMVVAQLTHAPSVTATATRLPQATASYAAAPLPQVYLAIAGHLPCD